MGPFSAAAATLVVHSLMMPTHSLSLSLSLPTLADWDGTESGAGECGGDPYNSYLTNVGLKATSASPGSQSSHISVYCDFSEVARARAPGS